MTYTLLKGSNLELLPTLADCSIDAIVTDPPYELGFMGKSWDASGIAYNIDLWRECLRVLKHGGHLVAFGGTRTYHRMACAIEDAGFEIRDSLHWIYGSGFPKSLDISKAIDKRGGIMPEQKRFAEHLRTIKPRNITTAQINKHIAGESKSNFYGHFIDTTSQPLLPTIEQYWKLKELLPIDNEWDHLFLPEAEREVIGTTKTNLTVYANIGGDNISGDVNVTAPATDEAKEWSGWGTALKPAHEPIVLARKPLIGTVAANVLQHGTGGLNIDACRIGTGETKTVKYPDIRGNNYNNAEGTVEYSVTDQGRFPANILHDGSPEVTERFPDTTSKSGGKSGTAFGSGAVLPYSRNGHDDSGSAARFFPAVGFDEADVASFMYCPKAGKKERNAGLEHMETRRASAMGYERGLGDAGEGMFKDRNPQKQNFHPTVKPIALMRWLIRLITPPNGTVLDPFAGSGTTLVAAIMEERNTIGIELTPDYWQIIEARCEHAQTTTQPRLI